MFAAGIRFLFYSDMKSLLAYDSTNMEKFKEICSRFDIEVAAPAVDMNESFLEASSVRTSGGCSKTGNIINCNKYRRKKHGVIVNCAVKFASPDTAHKMVLTHVFKNDIAEMNQVVNEFANLLSRIRNAFQYCSSILMTPHETIGVQMVFQTFFNFLLYAVNKHSE